MSSAQNNEEDLQIVRYVLDQLSGEEVEQIEELYFSDSSFLERIKIAEDQLVCDYLDSRLSAADLSSFEQKCRRVPELREKVQLEGLLRKQLAAAPVAARKNWFTSWTIQFAFLILTLVVVAGVWWLLRGPLGGRGRAEPRVLAFAVEPGLAKGAEQVQTRRFTLYPGVSQIQISLKLPGLAGESRVDIEALRLDPQGRHAVLVRRDLPTNADPLGRNVTLAAQPAELPTGDYIIYVRRADGNNDIIGSFAFSLLPR